MMKRLATARHVRRLALLAGAMLASGCFHAAPSVKQSMTSGAPIVARGASTPAHAASASARASRSDAPAAGHGTIQAAATGSPSDSFDLHKPGVESSVADFQTNLRDFFDHALERGARYLPTMTDILVREGLPAELAYLPLIESGYQPLAVSPAGAVGPWQFIPETGRRYGLRIDSLVDERRDPIKSTEAAVQYLKDLHDMFGDWELSLAAYNSGEYRVARILAQTDADDYWDMRERGYLPTETQQYVPRFLAAVRIAAAPESYGFEAPTHQPLRFELVNVDRQVSLRTAAGLCGVSASELADLNPELRRGITPSGYALRVPTGAAEPLRLALANYVAPARSVAHTTRSRRRGTTVARSSRVGGRVARRATARTRLAKRNSRSTTRKVAARQRRKPSSRISGRDRAKRRDARADHPKRSAVRVAADSRRHSTRRSKEPSRTARRAAPSRREKPALASTPARHDG